MIKEKTASQFVYEIIECNKNFNVEKIMNIFNDYFPAHDGYIFDNDNIFLSSDLFVLKIRRVYCDFRIMLVDKKGKIIPMDKEKYDALNEIFLELNMYVDKLKCVAKSMNDFNKSQSNDTGNLLCRHEIILERQKRFAWAMRKLEYASFLYANKTKSCIGFDNNENYRSMCHLVMAAYRSHSDDEFLKIKKQINALINAIMNITKIIS